MSVFYPACHNAVCHCLIKQILLTYATSAAATGRTKSVRPLAKTTITAPTTYVTETKQLHGFCTEILCY